MKIWYEYEIDAYKYYNWFVDKAKESNISAEMSVCSINAFGLYGNIDLFIDACTKKITELFITAVLSSYKVYLFANIEVRDPSSRVAQYRKVWKNVEQNFDIEGFIKGEEIRNEPENLQFYTSTAEIPLIYLDKAIKIVISNPDRFTLFISKANTVLSKEFIQHMFSSIIQVNKYGSIDYYKLSLTCCMNEDIGVRYGTTYTEAELALIYNPHYVKMQLF